MKIDGQRLAWQVLIICLMAELTFFLLDVFVNYYRWADSGAVRRLFNMAREDGIGSWFMVLQTSLAALVLALICAVEKYLGQGWNRKAVGWGLVALFFFYLSADDAAKIHERMGTLFDHYGRDDSTIGQWFPSYGWQVVMLPLFALAGGAMVLFLWQQFRHRGSRVILLLAPAVMALAVGIDFIEGLELDHPLNLNTWVSETYGFGPKTVRHFAKVIEEVLEMLSISLFLMLFIRQLFHTAAPRWTVEILEPARASAQ